MSKTKNYYWDLAEKAVDAILLELKNQSISKEAAKAKIMQVDNLDLIDIDEWNIDEILDVDGYDILIVGPTDLSASMGIHGDIHNEKIVDIMEDLVEKATKAGKVLGSTFVGTEKCEKWIKKGYSFMNIADPLSLGTDNLKLEIERLKNL